MGSWLSYSIKVDFSNFHPSLKQEFVFKLQKFGYVLGILNTFTKKNRKY